jgi:hypothetical protein
VETIVRGSEYQSFLDCRKEWKYAWIDKIEPKRQDNKLFFGTLFHKFLEAYYMNGCDFSQALSELDKFVAEQDMSGMEQFEIDDLFRLLHGVAVNYHERYGIDDKKFEILGTEVEFLVYLDGGIYMNGTIDLIYKLDGKVRFADHKTVASLTMYEDKSKMDRQISRYWWALQQISKGVGFVKNAATGEFEPWQELLGLEIDGFDYNLIAKDFPKEPKQLKPKKGQSIGALSVDKSQKTTYDLYLRKIQQLGLEESDYTEMLEMLKAKQDLFLNRIDVLRTQTELEAAAMEFFYVSSDIQNVRMLLDKFPEQEEQMTYRNIGNKCTTMCSFTAICRTAIEGGNVSLTKNLAYRAKVEVK